MTLTGKDAEAFVAELRERNTKIRADALDRAKTDAALAGKERFDLAKLEALADTSREGKLDPVEERRAKFEEMYYVEYPDVMTIKDFAKKVAERNSW